MSAGSRTGSAYLELSKKALDAATAIDNCRLGGATEERYEDIRQLSESLYKITEQYEPRNMSMMTRVIWPDREDWKGKTVEDTKLQTWLFAKELETFTESSRERQGELLAACLDLSNEAERFSMPLVLQKHPYKRRIA